MGHVINFLDIEHAFLLIRHAITAGRAESAIPLIDGVRKCMAGLGGSEEELRESMAAIAKECDGGIKKTKLDADLLWARIRTVERCVWAKLPDARVGSSLIGMGKRVAFCAWTCDWKVRASMSTAALELEEPFDPDEIASAITKEMRKKIST